MNKISKLEKFIVFCKECWKGKSLVRTLNNIHLLEKESFIGKGIDFGAKNGNSSYYRFINVKKAHLTYTDLYSQIEKVKSLDFEKDFDFSNEAYNFAIIFNTLEHIYNFQNFVNNISKSLVEGGRLEGSVPFLINYHKDPDDFFRYTYTALRKILEKANFANIEITPICQGVFSVSASLISSNLKFKPLILLTWCSALFLDKKLNKFSKENQNFYAELAFTARKKEINF